MQLRNLTRRARWFVGLGCLFTLASCGPFDSPPAVAKVDVDTLSTNILFGVPTPRPAAAQSPQAQALAPPPFVVDLPGQPSIIDFGGNPLSFPSVTAAPVCPTAPPTAFPAQPANSDVNSMPGTGAYRWAAGGTYDKTVGLITVPLPLPQFEQRVVRHATQITDPIPGPPGSQPDFAFTYETIEPRVSDNTALLLSWQVKANAQSVNTGVAPTVADPEAGLVLKKVQVIDSTGKLTSTALFDSGSGPGLLILPLPVAPGTSFSSTAVDTSSSANTLKLSGTVGNHENVDACGTPIQAWKIDGTLTTGATAATPATLHYDVATQMGALIIAFDVDGSFFGTTFHKSTARIGQPTGDAVPDKYK